MAIKKRSPLIILFSIELFICLSYSLTSVAIEPRDETPALIFQTWMLSAIIRIIITHSELIAKKILPIILASMIIGSTIQGFSNEFPYFHQVLFISAVNSIIFSFGASWPHEGWRGRMRRAILRLALPLAILIWSITNIAFVLVAAHMAAKGKAYCLLIPIGRPSEYRQPSSLFQLQGLNLYVPFTGGGSHSYQWFFHALHITNSRELSNWSFQSQRFEPFTSEYVRYDGIPYEELNREACVSSLR